MPGQETKTQMRDDPDPAGADYERLENKPAESSPSRDGISRDIPLEEIPGGGLTASEQVSSAPRQSTRNPEEAEAGRQEWKEKRKRARENEKQQAPARPKETIPAREAPPVVIDEDRGQERVTSSTTVLTANVSDQPTATDTLGFAPYVEAIAAFLTHEATKPPLTLSIEGEWGSGKSSFMLQLADELRKKSSVVHFNAWRYDKDDAMWAAFAMKFARELSLGLKWWPRWLAHMKLFVRRFNWQDGWQDLTRIVLMGALLVVVLALPVLMRDRITQFIFPPPPATATATPGGTTKSEPQPMSAFHILLQQLIGAGGGLAYIALVVGLAVKLKDVVGNPLNVNIKQHLKAPDYKSRVAFIEGFHEDFGRVVEVYGKNRKVFVFVDDLDRCEVPRAADLMQALNLMIHDSDQLVFIMGMDREKVAAGLAVKYEKLLPYLAPSPKKNNARNAKDFDPVLGLEYGYSFIEKFIQLPFLVPQASADQVNGFLEKLLGSEQSPEDRPLPTSPTAQTASGKEAEEAVTEDSKMVSEILQMVAPAFEYNPRRLKQFINAFRLKTFIASRTGLFEEPADASPYKRLTVFQLGKFVAIGLRWPLLLADVDKHRQLFGYLEAMFVKKSSAKAVQYGEEEDVDLTEALERWYSRSALKSLLRFGCETNGVWDEFKADTHALSRTNINQLLQVSPRTAPSTRFDRSEPDGPS
jgi:KAP family P-loop domain